MELEPGTLVTPNVRLVRELGRGGMGSVWVAYHTALGTEVAVKFVSAEIIEEEPDLLERFYREASMSAQIKSPYVVQTFDHGVSAEGRPYIVMELLEGESLAEILDRRQLSLDEAALVISQAAKALSKAHKLGIVHRDIKPDNLFVSYEDEEMFVKVLDFGIAKQTGLPKASRVTSTGVMVGTPEYMSPEQVLSSKSVDFRADLWGLGVVAYHCLTGGVPFTGETLGSLCVSIANGKFPPPSTLRVGLPATVDTWFERALDVDPYARFESARHLARTFAGALKGEIAEDFTGTSGDWSGPQPQLVASMRQEMPSDLALAQASASGAAHAASDHNPVPTFAGTTVDPDVPKRRTVAAVGAVGLLLTVGIGVGLLAPRSETPVAEPSHSGAEAPAARPAAPTSGPTSEVSAAPAGPIASVAPSASAETVAPDPSAEASSKEPSTHAPPTSPPKSPRPTTSPKPVTTPKPTGDKYGF